MNNSAILYAMLVLAITVFACSGDKPAGETSEKKAGELSGRPQRPFPAFLHGVWVRASYEADIKRTRSPARSSIHLGGIASMTIDSASVADDTLEIGFSFNNHEGSSFTLYLRPGLKANSFPISEPDYDNPTNFYELSYRIKGRDTSVFLDHYNSKKQLLKSERYTRAKNASDPEQDLAEGIQYIVNKHLMAGTYTATDTTGHVSSVVLGVNGELSGFPGVETYYVLTDFVLYGEECADHLCFDIQTPRQHCYAFDIAGDTLRLYEHIEGEGETTGEDLVKRGALLYTLVRK